MFALTLFSFPTAIPLKSDLAYEILERGQVRFWLQAESLSPDASYRFVINDTEAVNSDVSKNTGRNSARFLSAVL